MKILEMVKKDVKLFGRDFKTLTLIIFTPLIIMLILSLVFSTASKASSITGVTLGVCNLDERKFDLDVPIFKVSDLGKNCAGRAETMVERGLLKAAVVIPPDFTKNIEEGVGSNLILHIDNSKSQTAIVSSNAIKALVQEINEDVGIRFIENAWENLNDLNENLKLVVSNLVLLNDEIILVNEEVNAITSSLGSLNLSATEEILDLVGENVNESALLVNDTLVLFDIIDDEFAALNKSLASIEKVYDEDCVLQQNIPLRTCEVLNDTLIDLRSSLTSISTSSSTGRTNLQDLIDKVGTSQKILQNVSEQIVLVENLKADVEKELLTFNATISQYNNQILETIDELEATTELLDIYTSRDPKNIVAAVSLDENFIHGEKSFFEILVPGLLSILLLFMIFLTASVDIVSERKRGTMARTFLSPTMIFTFLTAKLIYLLILAAVELIVMVLIVFFVSKFLVLTTAMVLLLMLISVCFILIGIVIGCFARSENTALLLSLVLAIPMLFLSGLFFPFEIMPPFMKFIGANLPLTLAITALEKIMIYQTALVPLTIFKLGFYALILFIVAYVLIKKNPTS